MQKRFNSLLTAAIICAATTGLTAVTQAADLTGTWTFEQAGRQGGDAIKITLKLKAEGDKLTGTLTRPPRRDGGQSVEMEVKAGKVKGNEISFETSVERGGNTVTTKYAGKQSEDGNTIVGKVESTGRGGQLQSRDWKATRVKT
ncbi:MAG: hypothetical protein HY735_36000 [Verrucomicrobia bacterium]|nr:hypothetical protein [Verrucomicrobiota bacterium]